MVVTRLIVAAFLTALAACAPPAAPPMPVPGEMDAAMERWQALDTEISKRRVFIQSRLEFQESRRATLSEADRANIEAASVALVEMDSIWKAASSDFLAGDVPGAVEQGEIAISKAGEALQLLGIDPGKP
jgi:hypothetical protein